MLNKEQAEAELKKYKNKEWAATRLGAVEKLPATLRETARTILGDDEEGGPKAAVRPMLMKEARKIFKGMDEAARLQLFEAIAPELGVVVERGWKLFDRLPFQSGYVRKPFRAPGHPDALINRRLMWVLQLFSLIGPYQKNITWFAAWAPHLTVHSRADNLGILLAAAIDANDSVGEEVFQILCASGRNEHEIGGMGRHVTRALLTASRPDGWQFVENMLVAAQREEGLRQVILETVDEAHPEAFRRMLRLILDQNLARFSATVRAFDTWLGYQWDAVSAGVVNKTVEKMLLYLEDSTAKAAALNSKDAEEVYLSLWCQAFEEAVNVLKPATELLKHSNAEHRFVATHLLDQLGLAISQKSLLIPLEDTDLRVATRALLAFQRTADSRIQKMDLFERLEKLLGRYPDKPEKLKASVWPWTEFTVSKELAADVLPSRLGERPPTRLIPHLQQMGTQKRATVIRLLAAQQLWDVSTRETLFALLGDASRSVREAALQHLKKCQITTEEAGGIEKLLERSSGDLRRGALTLLSGQADEAALASAERLVAARSQPQRVAGLELLRLLVENKRCVSEARERAAKYQEQHPKLNEAERQQLEVVLDTAKETPVLDNALGLIRHEDRTWPPAPESRGVQFQSPAAARIVKALEEMLTTHAQETVSFTKPDGDEWKGLLSDLLHGFPQPDAKKTPEEDRRRLPLASVWESWWQSRGPEFRDADGRELLRALAHFEFFRSMRGDVISSFPEAIKTIFGEIPTEKRQREFWNVGTILRWLIRFNPPTGGVEFALDAAESALALIPESAWRMTAEEAAEIRELTQATNRWEHTGNWAAHHQKLETLQTRFNWRERNNPFAVWPGIAETLYKVTPQLWNAPMQVRRWKLLRWMDEPVRAQERGGTAGVPLACCLPRERPDLEAVALAYGQGGPTEADVIEHLIGARPMGPYFSRRAFIELQKLSRRKPRTEFANHESLTPIMERCRKRVLEVELTRGDNPTAASGPALSLGSVLGVANLMAILRALGKRNFTRGWSRDNESVETVFSHLARCSFPLAGETATDFSREAKAAGIREERLIELAVYAPQWAQFVEQTLEWNQLAEAVWWIHAHTKGMDWTVDREIRDLWEADMNSRTSLSSADLLEGAVDVAWFHRVHEALGPKRWNTLYEAAKFASTGSGHARAQLFADAMLDKASKRELIQRITKKRYQDAVRALGLLPLADGKKRETDLLDRYKAIQEFRRGSKQFGSQRQASEKRAAQIAQQNLARTAGYADPIRLEWAMEAKAVEDVADGPIEVAVEDVKLSLGIDPWGEIEFRVTRDGKELADVPAKLKKHAKITALRERKVELKRQASRIRPSLEQFMVRGDEFSGAELRELMTHPLLAPMLKNLVIIGEGIAGYSVHDGKALENHAGEVEAIRAGEKLRIAHPHDLLPAAKWHAWQKDCFARERIQPFKQVFRELYPLTGTEKVEGIQTRRYAGHQVQPRQALALLGLRGWVHHPEEGVRKVFHDAGLVAWLHFQEGFSTPAEIEGLTLESVYFTKRDEDAPLKLDALPPRLFSEAMRDLDLVVSVAHRGGVDPEASASTVEMRATLVEQTAQLLKLKNVKLKDRYALIKGQLGEYSVHLGSAVTRKMPGEMLFLVPVHSQHRGRLFLPFADDDPKTAEVMSKVLLLARDGEIKDPNILDQIRMA